MASKADKSAKTQKQIIQVAQEIFARDGYADASLAEIVDRADVTTGAVYHHFGGKKGLFTAVAENVEQMIMSEAAAAAPQSGEPWALFEKGVLMTLEICARPDIQRIVFRDAPNVVGLAEWREIEIKYAFGLLRKTIAQLSKAGLIDATNTNLTAQILLGAIIEAAHGVALADNKAKALSQAKATLQKMLRALKTC